MLKKLILVVAMLCLPMAFVTGCSNGGDTAPPATAPADDGSGAKDDGGDADAGGGDADAGDNTTE